MASWSMAFAGAMPLARGAFARHAALAMPRTVSRSRAFPARVVTRAINIQPPPPPAGGGEAGDSVVATVERKITEAINPTSLVVTPSYGDPNGSHVTINVVSEAFEGLNVVKRHKLVYGAIWEELSGPIHAVDQLVTQTPAEASKK
ncbi:hypothetical protein BU14_0371s0009 [Porphyra umbilicalis]|uniref:BolA protein n=1 Tax=Porphyra umbilicalis TaxID=2786 RepID=A0A1X6NXF3_PORUM|nr:hypothetical protein BU14_0371s0009 [Porphyra umbilicalis]|eukprot:OSX73176.1 hypothetical protein BU14_0371s0009 [Porphyra umbilicalis]